MDKTFMHQTISTSPSPRSKKRGRISTRSFLFALILIVAAISLIAGPAIPTKILASRLDQKDQLSTQGVSPSASLQIQALEDEKETRTPVKLDQFNGNFINAEMVKAFISSHEYRQRFGP